MQIQVQTLAHPRPRAWLVLDICQLLVLTGFPGGSEIVSLQCRSCRRHRIDPWVWKISWRRAWQLILVFFPGESHGQRSLVGYSPWDHKGSDTTEVT